MTGAGYHEVRFTYDSARAAVWRPICRYVQRYVFEDLPLLDLGAGYGEFHRFLRSGQKWALDANTALARYWDSTVKPLTQSALDPLPFERGSLGTILASNFFEHFTLDQVQSILSEAARILRPGGRLVVIQPDFGLEPRRYFDDYTHRTAFTCEGFSDMLRVQGWNVVRLERRFLPFSMKSRLPKSRWLVSLYLTLPWRPLAGQFLVVAEAPKGDV